MRGADGVEAMLVAVHPELVRVLTVQCGGRGVAEELAQEALLRAWIHRDELATMASPRGWIFRTALNLSSSRWRRRAAERRALNRLALTTAETVPPSGPEPIGVPAVRALLAELPPRQRAAVALRHVSGLSVDEVAVALECAPGTVKALTHQGMTRLRAQLRSGDSTAPAGPLSPDQEVPRG